jgi:hypothetical protein
MPPSSFADFVDLVVPELQRRGRMWRDYEGNTLRESIYQAGQARVRDDHPAARHRPPSPHSSRSAAFGRNARQFAAAFIDALDTVDEPTLRERATIATADVGQ